MVEGSFPKSDGQSLYGSEITTLYTYPKLLSFSEVNNFTFTPTRADSIIIITVKGQANQTISTGTATNWDIDLEVDSVVKDTVKMNIVPGGANPAIRFPFFMQTVIEDMTAASHDIDLTPNGGSTLSSLKIVIMEYTKL